MKRWLLLLILIVMIAGAFAWWMRRELHQPVAHTRANEYIEIPRGSTPDEIATKLVNAGVLRRKWPFLLYIKLSRSARLIRSGEYRFPSPISPLGVLHKLEEGEQRLSRLTIVEGWTRWDIAASLSHIEDLH